MVASGDDGSDKPLTDEHIINQIANPRVGMEGFIGGFVKNTRLQHVNKSEALVFAQKKVRGMISNAIPGDEADTHVDMPSGVRELIDPIKQKINELHQRKSNGEENVIKDLMQGLPEQSLNHALEVMEKKSGVQQHERISQLADVLVEEIGLLDTSISYLNKMKA